MLTDYDKLKKLLFEFEINIAERSLEDKKEIIIAEQDWDWYDGKIEKFNSNEKIKGYFGFYTTFTFDEDGNFINVGIWE
jgi:hypothetical protein